MHKKQIYDTIVCKFYDTAKIISAYEKESITSDVPVVNIPNVPDVTIVQVMPDMDVPQFSHPIILTKDNTNLNLINTSILIDMRPHVTKSSGGGYELRSRTGIHEVVTRGVLTLKWLTIDTSYFLNSSDFHTKMFMYWVGSTLGRLRNLEPETQHKVNKILALYYVNLFKDGHDVELTYLCSKKASVSVGIPYEDMLEIADKIDDWEGFRELDGLSTVLSELTETTLLKDVSPIVLINYVSSSWIGSHGKELSAIALEHPPTFLSMLLSTINDRTMAKTQLGRLLHNMSRSSEHVQFVKQIDLLMNL